VFSESASLLPLEGMGDWNPLLLVFQQVEGSENFERIDYMSGGSPFWAKEDIWNGGLEHPWTDVEKRIITIL